MGLVLSSSSCNPQDAPDPDGVKINGVVWAKYNVDSPGFFAPNPGSPGRFYQWNRKIGWPATGSVSWDTTNPPAAWNSDNDPCPDGWSVPTILELERLCDGTKVLFTKQTQDGYDGMLFTDIASNNSIFLPPAGGRNNMGVPIDINQIGNYWSNTAKPDNNASVLGFSMPDNTVRTSQNLTTMGLSIRCVKK